MRSSLGHGGDLAGTLRAERYIHTQSGDGSRMSRGTFFISVWMPYAWHGAIFHFSKSFSKEIYKMKIHTQKLVVALDLEDAYNRTDYRILMRTLFNMKINPNIMSIGNALLKRKIIYQMVYELRYFYLNE